ncbi:MAG: response regulator [Verrucomicrobiota bacterium]|jgi:PAS domain S-box-containing protein
MSLETSAKRIVWVIDDDETVLLLAEEVLSSAGFQVKTFSDAAQALSAAANKLPDLVVVDVIMPGMNGFDFCSGLRQLPHGGVIPVLVTTSLDDTASINQAYQAGATNFATKPVNWTIEVQRLHYLLKSADIAAELQRKEHETRSAKEDWERTFDSIGDSVTVLDPNLTILRANRATVKMFGGSESTVIGRPCHELFYSSNQRCPDCPVGQVLASGSPTTAEIQCAPAGKLFEITVSPVTDRRGQITRMVHVARDLSEKKKLEAEFRHAQKMEAVGTLAGGIAHDFNNLLTAILCCAELGISEDAEAGRTDENLEAIMETAKRGSALTKQLLLFSRKKSDSSQRQLLDLNLILKNMRRMLEKGLSPTVSQEYKLAPDLHQIRADSGQLEQVLMNLAVNASHAMPLGGTLTIETRNIALEPEFCHAHPNLRAGGYVLLTVADTGHGMGRETLARIYEPFFTTKKIGEGTGLGLSVVFGIIQEHNGHIECHSEVGQGTTFQIYLPAVLQRENQITAEPATVSKLPGGTETILVVDDEAPIRRLLERHLGKLGYNIISAADGEMGLHQFTEASPRPHAVILDLGMPKTSGWECLEKLRAFDQGIKVLVASGYGSDDLDARVVEKGATGLLHKPYDLATLTKRLREVLDVPAKPVGQEQFQI